MTHPEMQVRPFESFCGSVGSSGRRLGKRGQPFLAGPSVVSPIVTPTQETCDVCRKRGPSGVQIWKRTLPDVDRVQLCWDCATWFALHSDDRGFRDEEGRMTGQFDAQAGEVWASADRVFWFRSPLLARNIVTLLE